DQGYLPTLDATDPAHPEWTGQEATAFPDNWSIGLSLLHTVFAREHNQFVAAFRRQAAATPAADCGLRRPGRANTPVPYRDVTAEELFEVARLVVAAEIAKIHTIEWTTQLLYNEPLYKAMNANWNGLVDDDNMVGAALARVVASLGASTKGSRAASWFSVLAAGAGIVGTGSQVEGWSIDSTRHLNGGVNHFGSPFNFPEEFVTVYRLHPLIPDVLEVRRLASPNVVATHVPTVATFRGKATPLMRTHGPTDWALSMGRQRLGLLTLQNSPRFLQHLQVNRAPGARPLDVMALDLLRDRERGVPRYNEFRRQYGLRHVRSFDDFVDARLAPNDPERARQASIVQAMREVYGQHRCDQRKVISLALRNGDGSPVTDCLGFPDGTMVDNVEDLDTVVGYLAEFTRPHGFAISETQFLVFVLNASRRLFSDRFFTSSYRPEVYSTLGMTWVDKGGPAPMLEPGEDNGHANQPVSTFKRVLLRTIPELAGELADVRNIFDPWGRDRGTYY
ncbi:MAG: oxygenase, partial [Gemmatimonadetes bacterium]|nr:oxygenase [Gemmatimonadota bacterium]